MRFLDHSEITHVWRGVVLIVEYARSNGGMSSLWHNTYFKIGFHHCLFWKERPQNCTCYRILAGVHSRRVQSATLSHCIGLASGLGFADLHHEGRQSNCSRNLKIQCSNSGSRRMSGWILSLLGRLLELQCSQSAWRHS